MFPEMVFRVRAASVAVIVGSVLVASGGGAAAAEGCFAFKSPVDRAAVEGFRADPAALMKSFPNGGDEAVVSIRNLLMTDPGLSSGDPASGKPSPVSDLFAAGSMQQKAAIAGGAAAAAEACTTTQPELALEIQKNVLASGDSAFIAAFRTASQEIETASIGSTAPAAASPIGTGPATAGNAGLDQTTDQSTPTTTVSTGRTVVRTVTRTTTSSVSPSSIGGL